jgi:transcriptional regulator with XRE-family HTH domain
MPALAFCPDRLRALRHDADLSRTALGARVGVTPGAIGHFENGYAQPSAATLGALAEALGAAVGDLYAPAPAVCA